MRSPDSAGRLVGHFGGIEALGGRDLEALLRHVGASRRSFTRSAGTPGGASTGRSRSCVTIRSLICCVYSQFTSKSSPAISTTSSTMRRRSAGSFIFGFRTLAGVALFVQKTPGRVGVSGD